MVSQPRSKHINVRYHKIQNMINDGELNLVKVYTKDNATDMLTKSLTSDKFMYCLNLVNVLG